VIEASSFSLLAIEWSSFKSDNDCLILLKSFNFFVIELISLNKFFAFGLVHIFGSSDSRVKLSNFLLSLS